MDTLKLSTEERNAVKNSCWKNFLERLLMSISQPEVPLVSDRKYEYCLKERESRNGCSYQRKSSVCQRNYWFIEAGNEIESLGP